MYHFLKLPECVLAPRLLDMCKWLFGTVIYWTNSINELLTEHLFNMERLNVHRL